MQVLELLFAVQAIDRRAVVFGICPRTALQPAQIDRRSSGFASDYAEREKMPRENCGNSDFDLGDGLPSENCGNSGF